MSKYEPTEDQVMLIMEDPSYQMDTIEAANKCDDAIALLQSIWQANPEWEDELPEWYASVKKLLC